VQKVTREKVIKTIKNWGGQLIEPGYTKGVSSTILSNRLIDRGITTNERLKTMNKLIYAKPIIRILEAHSGITGLIVEKTKVEVNGETREFDGIWLSSLTTSVSMGKPDTEIVDFSSRFQAIEEILEVTTKPIIVDGDSGGEIEHFRFRVKTLERLGVSAIVVEDKIGIKRNSLLNISHIQEQDSIDHFCEKIREGEKALLTNDFMIIARIESFILNKGLNDAIMRAKAYINAGADGILIHSKKQDGKEIKDFCEQYRLIENRVPLVVVPTTYHHITEDEFSALGVNVVIYANHLLRSAYPAMVKTAKSILTNRCCSQASVDYCMPVKEILVLIPEDK